MSFTKYESLTDRVVRITGVASGIAEAFCPRLRREWRAHGGPLVDRSTPITDPSSARFM
jgi:hypothetical protein